VEKEIRRAQGGASGENSGGKDSNADKKGADSLHAKATKKDKR
jgi:hypothetical protein